MPHGARRISESGYYHVVPKGIADQILFEDDDDRRYYLSLLRKATEEAGIRIIAYCLMSNHVHLVICDGQHQLSDAMKLVDERYGTSFAEKTGRTGGVFRKPFWSEPIEADAHLLCAVRYVHANPAAAGICPASAYEWSSAQDYLGRRRGITDTAMVLEMLGGIKGFIEFSRQAPTAVPFEGSRLTNHLSEDDLRRIAEAAIAPRSLGDVAGMELQERNVVVRSLSDLGLSGRLISRLTGLGRYQVVNAFR